MNFDCPGDSTVVAKLLHPLLLLLARATEPEMVRMEGGENASRDAIAAVGSVPW